MNLWFAMRYYRDLAWNTLLKHVLPWMGAGALVGFRLSDGVQGPLLRRAFGVFVVAVAGRAGALPGLEERAALGCAA